MLVTDIYDKKFDFKLMSPTSSIDLKHAQMVARPNLSGSNIALIQDETAIETLHISNTSSPIMKNACLAFCLVKSRLSVFDYPDLLFI